MAALTYTYTTLAAAMQSWPLESDPAYVTDLPEIIRTGELDLTRELGLEIFDVDTTASITSGSGNITKPTSMIAPVALWYTNGSDTIQLTRATPDFVRMHALGSSGNPRYYCENTETTWKLSPTPNFNGTLNVRQTIRGAGLDHTTGASTSWLSTKMPDLLLLACLMAAHRYLRNDPKWERAKTDFDRKIAEAKAEVAQLRRVRAEDQTMGREVIRPTGSEAQPVEN